MSEQKKPDSKPDDLTKTTEPASIDLTEEELGRVAGGYKPHGSKIDNLKIAHKGE